MFLTQTTLLSQFEVLGVVKPTTSEEPCDGKINLRFVESELPYKLDFTSTSGQNGSHVITSTVFSSSGLCPGTITINAVDNHGCDATNEVVLEECGDIDVSFEQEDEECNYAGIKHRIDWRSGGRILYEYKLLPLGINNELTNLGISYDLTRRISRNNTSLAYSGAKIKYERTNFPLQNELANDDSNGDDYDEDEVPSENEIYHYDAPSEQIISSGLAFDIRYLSFEEFVRVSFKNDIIGDVQEGSRCSPKYNWELKHGVRSSGTFQPSDPYDGNFQKLEPYNSTGLKFSTPRRVAGSSTGKIIIKPKSSSTYVSYILQLASTGDVWHLIARKPSGGIILLKSSNYSTTSGPWKINYTTVDIEIPTGTFSSGAVFLFNIWDLPAPDNKLITY